MAVNRYILPTWIFLVVLTTLNMSCEVSYNGQSLSSWSEQLRSGENPGEAAKALVAIIQDSKNEESDRKKAYELLTQAGVWNSEVFEALEILIKNPSDDQLDYQMYATEVLAKASEAGVDRTLSLLDHDDPHIRFCAATAIHKSSSKRVHLRKHIETKIPILIRHLKRFERPNNEGLAGSELAMVFSVIGTEKAEAVPQLISILEHIHKRKASNSRNDPFLAVGCIKAINGIGKNADAAIPILNKLLYIQDRSIAEEAAKARKSLGISGIEPRRVLLKARSRKVRPKDRLVALEKLKEAPANENLISELIKILENQKEPEEVRQATASTLAHFKDHDIDKIFDAIHQQMTENLNSTSMKMLAYSLSSFGARAVDAIPIIAKDLKSLDFNEQERAIKALANIGSPAAHLASQFYDIPVSAKNESKLGRKITIIKSLIKMKTLKDRAVQDCLSLLKQENVNYANQGAVLLRHLKPEAKSVVNELKTIADNTKENRDLKVLLQKTILFLEFGDKD